jgi:SHS family lactate transporter-like MFS transporter
MLTSSTSLEKRSRSDRHASFPLGFGGWTLDSFDYFLVIFCLTDIGHQIRKPDTTVTLAIPMPERFPALPRALTIFQVGRPRAQ